MIILGCDVCVHPAGAHVHHEQDVEPAQGDGVEGEEVGGGAALAFGIALMASGFSSSSVGTYAGQIVMAGFMNRQIPLLVRRALTRLPSLVILALAGRRARASRRESAGRRYRPRGRLDLGLGKCGYTRDMAAFDVLPSDLDRRYQQDLEILSNTLDK